MKSCSKARIFFLAGFLWPFFLIAQTPVDNVSPNRLTITLAGHPLKLPYYRNFSLGSRNENIRRAVVVIHGTLRNADDYYQRILDPARTARKAGETIIIAPQFLIEEDVTQHSLPDDVLFWNNSGWKKGDRSRDTNEHPRPARISSFAVVDSICYRLAQNNVNLEKLILVGHSAGSQFVNRFTAGSRIEDVLVNDYGIQVRYVVANPSSYLYFNDERHIAGTLDQFAVPNTNCATYDDYKYGLNRLNSYMAEVGAEQITAQYSRREVIYLLGAQDNDPRSSNLDRDCEAMLQGAHRLERGKIYYHYLRHFFGDGITDLQPEAIVPGVGHSSSGMFASKCGIFFLFDSGGCSTIVTSVETGKESTHPTGFLLRQNYPNPFNPSTTIRFSLSQPQHVRLAVFDLLGRQVIELLSEEMSSGEHAVVFDARGLASGLYFYRLTAGRTSQVRKTFLLR
ncbi:MAG: T9SS type A sorting domain-containing protein [bacterium]